MSTRLYESTDSQGQHKEPIYHRRAAPIMTTSIDSTGTLPPKSHGVKSSPTLRSPPLRSDKLSLRLRSNSGLALHTNESALSQYIDYKRHRPARPFSFDPSIYNLPLDEEEISSSQRIGDLTSRLPILDFLGKDAFKIALADPVVTRQFLKYCKGNGCEENLEFLLKVREYSKSTSEMASILTTISTSFIASGATHSLNLPTMVSKALSSDMKRIAQSTLPSLEAVFCESRSHIERHLSTAVFPGFIKNQFVLCMAAFLSAGGTSGAASSKSEFAGLGESFCLTDASSWRNTTVGLTDAFLTLTGYQLQDAISRNCNFLQGPYTNIEAIRRIQLALKEQREAVELLLNYRKNGEPFWNLFFLYPLRDRQGKLRHWLGAQVNVSDSVGSQKDLLRILNGGSGPHIGPQDTIYGKTEQLSWCGLPRDTMLERDLSVHSRESSQGSKRHRLLQQFRKPSNTPSLTPSASSDYAVSISRPSSRNDQFSTPQFQPRAPVPKPPTIYSYHILLKCTPTCAPSSSQRYPTSTDTRKKLNLKLRVGFYSEEIAQLLSLRYDHTEMDIFHVLVDKTNSPSVTKSFKTTIRERIECGKSTSIEILVNASRMLFPGRADSVNGLRPKTVEPELEKNAKPEKKSARHAKQDKLMSHWTPMRNADGNIEYVVLILAPAF
ncbi:hypothetical protein F5B20DRAFT_402631 [Whalleya microplaca]|nr:hypothetical protein F5B20DRAFT_402631 [Whalleya microplaca]